MTNYRKAAQPEGWGTADWLLTAFYALLLLWLLPRTITIRSDDFAYLEVTVQTIRTHLPAISDWFEANNVAFSYATAGVYWLTGNFYLASYGVLAAFATGAFAVLNLLIVQTDALTAPFRRLLAFAVVLAPVYLNKSLDFVGVMPALFFFLLALLFFVRREWVAFFLAAAGAFLTRETGLMLMVLAGGEILRRMLEDRRDGMRLGLQLFVGFAAIAALVLLVKHNMPLGWVAQRLTVRSLDRFNPVDFLDRGAAGLSIAFSALILFRAVIGCPRHPAAGRYGAVLLAVTGAICLLLGARGTAISLEFPLPRLHTINGAGIAGINLVFMLLALRGLGAIPRNPLALTQLAAIVVISARGGWWDYYLLEILLMSLLQALLERRAEGGEPVGLSRPAAILFALMLTAEAGYALYYKLLTERMRLQIAVLEPHYRRHDISPQAVTDQPWGYAAWYMFESYIHRHPDAAGASSFAAAFENGGTSIRIAFSAAGARLPGCAQIETGNIRLLGVRQFYAINRCGESRSEALPIPSARFFPQNNREWSDYIAGRGFSSAPAAAR